MTVSTRFKISRKLSNFCDSTYKNLIKMGQRPQRHAFNSNAERSTWLFVRSAALCQCVDISYKEEPISGVRIPFKPSVSGIIGFEIFLPNVPTINI